jgi:NitT/TauT family transport system substrate-binding protein
VLADPDASIKYVKERDALIDEALEKRRLKLAIESVIATPAAKADGIGEVNPARLADMVTQVTSAFELKNPVKADAIFSTAFLPPKAERMVFPK